MNIKSDSEWPQQWPLWNTVVTTSLKYFHSNQCVCTPAGRAREFLHCLVSCWLEKLHRPAHRGRRSCILVETPRPFGNADATGVQLKTTLMEWANGVRGEFFTSGCRCGLLNKYSTLSSHRVLPGWGDSRKRSPDEVGWLRRLREPGSWTPEWT